MWFQKLLEKFTTLTANSLKFPIVCRESYYYKHSPNLSSLPSLSRNLSCQDRGSWISSLLFAERVLQRTMWGKLNKGGTPKCLHRTPSNKRNWWGLSLLNFSSLDSLRIFPIQLYKSLKFFKCATKKKIKKNFLKWFPPPTPPSFYPRLRILS